MSKKGRRSDLPRERVSLLVSSVPHRLADALEKIDDLMRAGDWIDARNALRGLNQDFPA